MNENSIGHGMTRMRYRRILWHLYLITEEHPWGFGPEGPIGFNKGKTYLSWNPRLSMERSDHFDKITKTTNHEKALKID
jgi:hypothetical protein